MSSFTFSHCVFISANGRPNHFAPLPPPAIFDVAYTGGYAYSARNETTGRRDTIVYMELESTPPLPVREDLFVDNDDVILIDTAAPAPPPIPLLHEDDDSVIEITQEEFLNSIPGWNPVPINRRFN